MRVPGIVAVLAALPASAVAQPSTAKPLRLSIEDAMRAVDRTSHPLAAARATSERAAADVVAARSGYFPQISVISSYVRTLESEFSGLLPPITPPGGTAPASTDGALELPFGRKHTWRAGISATQLIWDGGLTSRTVEVARGSERAANLDVRIRHAQAVFDVTVAYYASVLAGRVVAIGEASLGLAERTLEQTRLGYEQGTTAEFDVVRSEVTRDNQRTALIRSRADRDDAFRRLRQLLGLPLDQPLVLTTELSIEDPTGDGHLGELARGAAGVPSTGERAAVAEARTAVDIRRAQRGIASSVRWPSLSLATDYGRVNYPDGFWPDGDWRTNWTIGVYLNYQVFTGFRTTAQIRGARADQRAAEELLVETQEQAELDERRTVSEVDVATATLAATHHSTELARRAYQIAEVRYTQGVSTYLELVDARIALDQAQINEASAARDVAVNRVRLALLPSLPVDTPGVSQSTALRLAVLPSTAATPLATMPTRASPASQGSPAQLPGPAAAAGTPPGPR